MENAEKRAFDIYHDWTNQINESAVSYSRQYNNRAMEHELKELSMLMDLADRVSANDQLPELELYDTPEQAEAVAIAMGGSGSHEHTADSGTVQYMPFTTHDEYEKLMRAGNGDQQTMRDKLRDRLEQLLDTSTTSNSQ